MIRTPQHDQRRGERGVSFLLVVAGMFAILAMAALSVDLVMMYSARADAQRAADAAALAGARMFVMSGITSGSGLGNICTGAAGDAANQMANTVAGANQVGGVTATVTNVACNLSPGNDPEITVTVSRTNLPTFFGRIFGLANSTVTAVAKAEAFNNSGSAENLQVGSVKPWFIPNCDPGALLPAGPCTDYFINSGGGYTPATPANYMGIPKTFNQVASSGTLTTGGFYPINTTNWTHADICPSTSAKGCTPAVGTDTNGGYMDAIACANPTPIAGPPARGLQCGDSLPINLAATQPDTVTGTECLIHTDDLGLGGTDQDTINPGLPVTINGGLSNPNPTLRSAPNISRSESVVSVPVFEWTANPCPGGTCTNQTVIGFLQLGIRSIDTGGVINAVVMNAVGCNPSPTGNTVSGGGVSALPVRLVQ
jgi:hypothetical protein